MVEKANKAIPIVTSQEPIGPKTDLNAAMVRADPLTIAPVSSVMPNTPVLAIARPVIVHTTIVSQNVPVILI